jgi:sarcosine oxidase
MRPGQAGHVDLAVVGLGAVGAACLYQAARLGARVVGIDRFSPPHDQGSSHGETRITRQAIGEGDAYVPLALRSHAIWDMLEAETGERLIDRCGFLLIVRGDAESTHHGTRGFLAQTVQAAQRFGIAHRQLDAADIAQRFPQFGGLEGDEEGYFEPGGGQLFPERCIAAQLAEARRLGAGVMTDCQVLGIAPESSGVRIRTPDRDILAARAIVAAGAWMPGLAPALAPRLRIHRQTLHWFALADDTAWRGEAPTYIWNRGPGPDLQFYGFPPLPGSRELKCAGEQYGAITEPDRMDRSVVPAEQAAMFEEHVKGRLVGASPTALRSAACCYTVAPGSDFIVEQHPDSAAILLVSACSGHGFKHSAALGEALVQSALSIRPTIDLAPFGLRP